MDDRVLRDQADNLHHALSQHPLPVVPTPNQCRELAAAALGATHGVHDIPAVMMHRPDHWPWHLERAVHRVETRLATLKRPDGQRGIPVPRDVLIQALADAWTLTRTQTHDLIAGLLPKPVQAAGRAALRELQGSFQLRLAPDGVRIIQFPSSQLLYSNATPIAPSFLDAIKRSLPHMEANSGQTTGIPGLLSSVWYNGHEIVITVLCDMPTQLDDAALGDGWRTLILVGGEDEARYTYTRQLIRAHIALGARVALCGLERWIAGSTQGVAAISPHLRRYSNADLDVEQSTIDKLCRDRPDIVVWVQPSIYGHDLPMVQRLLGAGIRVVLDTRRWEPDPQRVPDGWAADLIVQF